MRVRLLAWGAVLFLGWSGCDDSGLGNSTCGDGICSGREDCVTCEFDCGPCGENCGDGACDVTETCVSCPLDCGECSVCGSECFAPDYTECTCDPSDPCGWRGDGFCDFFACLQAGFADTFDDSPDCSPQAVACDGDCAAGRLTACSCAANDPCGWAGDGVCDQPSCSSVTGAPFDDSADCGGGCAGECARGIISACTCDPSDPCGWVGDGYCDQYQCRATTPSATFDDSADCAGVAPPPPETSFMLTVVRNELDPQDAVIFGEGLAAKGYVPLVLDPNVTAEKFLYYLSQDVQFLYHTGHGLEGAIVLAGDVILPRDLVGTVGTRNLIFATCLTLADTGWPANFGPTTQSILGYTQPSLDQLDNTVVELMLDELGVGRLAHEAWYLANVQIEQLADRWAAYVREPTGIVEYSARAGVAPPGLAQRSRFVPLDTQGRLFADADVLGDRRTFADAFVPLTVSPERLGIERLTTGLGNGWRIRPPAPGADSAVAYDAAGSRISVRPATGQVAYDRAGALFLGPVRARPLEVAEAFLATLGGVPADADAPSVSEVVVSRPGAPDVTVASVVRYSRRVGGLPVVGNAGQDGIVVVVAEDEVRAYRRFWPEVTAGTVRQRQARAPHGSFLGVGRALRIAAPAIGASLKGSEVHVVAAEPAVGVPAGDRAARQRVPAYAYRLLEGGSLVVDARTGELLW